MKSWGLYMSNNDDVIESAKVLGIRPSTGPVEKALGFYSKSDEYIHLKLSSDTHETSQRGRKLFFKKANQHGKDKVLETLAYMSFLMPKSFYLIVRQEQESLEPHKFVSKLSQIHKLSEKLKVEYLESHKKCNKIIDGLMEEALETDGEMGDEFFERAEAVTKECNILVL